MKTRTQQFFLLFLVAILTVAVVPAKIGAIDPVPSATLLLPFFFVDTSSSGFSEFPGERGAPFNSVNTVATIHNNSDQKVLAHVTLWTDWGIPTLTFDVGLEAYGTQELNLYHILNGRLPDLEPFKSDFPNCDPVPDYSSFFTAEQLVAAHTGNESKGSQCYGSDQGDEVARGYVTVDVANSCSIISPDEPGYFASGGQGVAANDNVLFGDYFLVDPANNFSHGENLVHIEADSLNPETSVPGEYTFYGSLLTPSWSAVDNREALATNWQALYQTAGAFDSSQLIVWRDPLDTNPQPISCGPASQPAWAPLGQEQASAFNEDMDYADLSSMPDPQNPQNQIPSRLFPLATQLSTVGVDVDPPFSNGWLYLNLNSNPGNAASGPPEDPAARQAYVIQILNATGRFSLGSQAIPRDSALNADHTILTPNAN